MLHNEPTTPIEILREHTRSKKDTELLDKIIENHQDLLRAKKELAHDLGYEKVEETIYYVNRR